MKNKDDNEDDIVPLITTTVDYSEANAPAAAPTDGAVDVEAGEAQKTKAKAGKLVKIVAPKTLPPDYILSVYYQAEEGKATSWKEAIVKIPHQGVIQGETFEARAHNPKAIRQQMGVWVGSEFNLETCFGPATDTDFCLLSCFCPSIAWACLYEHMNDLEGRVKHKPLSKIKSIGILSGFILVLTIISIANGDASKQEHKLGSQKASQSTDILQILGGIILLSTLIIRYMARYRIRRYYQIDGENCVMDLCCIALWAPCSALLAYRHMKRAHDHPNLGYCSRAPLTEAKCVEES